MVPALAPNGRYDSGRARVTQIRALEVATLAPNGRYGSGRATVTQIRALAVATFALNGCYDSGRATVTGIWRRGHRLGSKAELGKFSLTKKR